MAEYQQIRDAMNPAEISETVFRYLDAAYIPPDPANRDRQAYEQYVADGGVTDPPDPLPDPPPPAPLELAAHPEGDMDAATKGYVDTEVARLTARLDAMERSP